MKPTEATVMAFMEAVYPGHAELMFATATEADILQEATRLINEREALRTALESAKDTIEHLTGQALPPDNEICRALRGETPTGPDAVAIVDRIAEVG